MGPKVLKSFRLDPDLAEKVELLTESGLSFTELMNLAVRGLLESENFETSFPSRVVRVVLEKQRPDIAGAQERTKVRRWTPRRKAALVQAVHAGLFSPKDALQYYALTPEEFSEWENEYGT